ncbi:unnamed protein product [Rotaria sp. Silwood1]|nr:unnamed protein product [Rotaria sp. Silwood1]CAF1618150.1 unnamed protein product [Rotaria sp. Silwood1]CAF3764238.1 unnamed protein product [Rotaria sp. Silwood1]CAF4787225.1 unnamed protein product [Rotaria sp. Silwood1]
MQQIENTHSSLPGIVVVGLLLDYLTRYYHHKKSLTTNTDEQIGSTLETSSSSTITLTINKTNKSILITTTHQYENLNLSCTSLITNSTQYDESIETTTINEQIKVNNKYDYLIEF